MPVLGSGNGMIRGVDVSSFQGIPRDWQAAAGEIDWAGVKLTEFSPGGARYVNPDARDDLDWLAAHGKGRLAYMFGHPGTSAAEAADYFLTTFEGMGIRDSDAVALDLEVTDGCNPAQVSVWARSVLRILQADLDRIPLLYTFGDFPASGNCAGLGGYPLWIADPGSSPGHPRIPAPWHTWAAHQYEITGPIDRDVANFASLPAMAAALGKATARPKPAPVTIEEDPMLLNRGAGAVTPVALPDAVKSVRLFCADGSAQLHYQFEGEIMAGLNLAWSTGSRTIDVPGGKNGIKFTRIDAGSNDVSVALRT